MNQRDLTDFDEKLRRKCEAIENAMFERESRNALLKSGLFEGSSLFGYVVAEVRRREEKEKKHGFARFARRSLKKKNGEKKNGEKKNAKKD